MSVHCTYSVLCPCCQVQKNPGDKRMFHQVQIEVTDENPAMFNLEWLDVCSEKVRMCLMVLLLLITMMMVMVVVVLLLL